MERGANDPEAARLAGVALFARLYAAGVVLVIATSLAGFVVGAVVAPLVLMRRVLPKVARRLTSA